MTKRFVAIGECMVELASAEGGLYSQGFAGDTFNTAWYARQIAVPGLEIAYMTAVGDDAMSERMAGFMRDAGIVPEFKTIPGGTPGLYMISLKDGERSFSYWRSAAAARQLADDLDQIPRVGAGDMAYFSGISIAILPVEGRKRLLAALSRARAAGVRVAFDPNLRPRLWNDTAEMCEWVMAAAAVSDIVLPSYEDEADFFGDADKAATAQRYRDVGATLVVVKDGPGDVLIVRDGAAPSTVPPETVARPVDTTAAGDSFNAGFLMGMEAGKGLEDAVAAGCRLAAHVVSSRGALVALPVSLDA